MEILYEDDHIIAVSKPPFLLVHRSRECTDKDNLLKQVRNKIDRYVYPLHRLDRAVSGIVVFAKNSEDVRPFQEIWHTNKIRKYYIGLTRGLYREPGVFDFALKDENKVEKPATTKYSPLVRFKTSTLMEIEILTGRHHQIRRHFARRVHHLLGDRKYGKKKYNDYYRDNFDLQRIFLHSHKMELYLPYNDESITIKAPLANDLMVTLEKMLPEYLETMKQSDYIPNYDR